MPYGPYDPRFDPIGGMPDPNSFNPNLGEKFPPYAKVKGRSLMDRFGEQLMPTPQGMEGLISAEDIAAARHQGLLGLGMSLLEASGPTTQDKKVGIMQAIGRGLTGGQGAYQQAIQGAAGLKGATQQYKLGAAKLQEAETEAKRQGGLTQGRQSIVDKYPMPKGDINAMAGWIDQVLPEFVRISDEETVARLSEIRKSIGEQKPKGSWIEVPGPDGKPRTRYVTQEEAGTAGIPIYEKPARDSSANLLDEQRMFTRANMLGDDYRNTTKSIQQAADQYRTLTATAPAAKAGSPQAQIALVFSFMKTLDPTSVVRESEYATAKNAAGVPERIRNQYNKVLDGHFLTPEQVDGFVRTGRSSAQQWKRQQDLHIKTFGQRARRWRIEPQDVTMDFFDGLPLDDQAAQPAWHPPMAPPGAQQMFPPRR